MAEEKTIYDVLADVQDRIEQPKLNAEVCYKQTKFRYADLSELWRVVNAARKGTGLYVRHVARKVDDGAVWVFVIAAYGDTELELAGVPANLVGRPQDVGSAITYAKRYSLAMAFGLAAEEDDDGQRGSCQEVKPTQAKPSQADRVEKGIKALMGISPWTRDTLAPILEPLSDDEKVEWLANAYREAKAQIGGQQ